MTEKQHFFWVDNLKLLLIFLVILGHIFEFVDGHYVKLAYKVIYLFHMPVFIFLSGYVAKFNRKRIFLTYLWAYIIFEPLYVLFEAFILYGLSEYTISYTHPHWILWYLVCLILYLILLPLFDTDSPRIQIVLLSASVIVSLLAGYENSIGGFLALSRFFTFLPYFLMGYYVRKNQTKIYSIIQHKKFLVLSAIIISGIVALSSIIWLEHSQLNKSVLRFSQSYESGNYSVTVKATVLLTAICWGILLIKFVPRRRIPVISTCGKNTFSIFLMHGMFTRFAGQHHVFHYPTVYQDVTLAVLITIALILLLGNPLINKIFYYIFTGKWLEERL